MMKPAKEIAARQRRLNALAASETNVYERLFAVRGELTSVLRALDRLGLPRHQRMLASPADSAIELPPLRSPSLANLLAFPRQDQRTE
jgi:hypothetical protein